MNLNKIFIIGRLTQDPELRSTTSGQSVATLRMATNRVWNDQSGNKKDATEFHTVVAWGRLGEIANQYLKKGSLAMIEGRIQTRTWMDPNNNVKKYFTEVVAEGLQLGPRSANPSSDDSGYDSNKPKQNFSNNSVKNNEEDNIPVIDADDPISSGIEEDEVKVKEEDLPF